jgi:hypothetical protein
MAETIWGILEFDNKLHTGTCVLVGLNERRASHMTWLMNKMDRMSSPEHAKQYTYYAFSTAAGYALEVRGFGTWSIPEDFELVTKAWELRTMQMVFIDEYVPAMERKASRDKTVRRQFELDKVAFPNNVRAITDYSTTHGIFREEDAADDDDDEEVVDPLNRWKAGDISEIKRRREAEQKAKAQAQEKARKKQMKLLKIKMKRDMSTVIHKCLDFQMRGYAFVEFSSFLASKALRGCSAEMAAKLLEEVEALKARGIFEKKTGLRWVPYKELEEFLQEHTDGQVTLSIGFEDLKKRVKKLKKAYADKWYQENAVIV